MNHAVVVSTRTAQENFYPTPPDLAAKMLAGIDWTRVETVLEPSAGKGDLVKAVHQSSRGTYGHVSVDCIEIDPNLRAVLSYNFSEGALNDIAKELDALENIPYSERTKEQANRMMKLQSERNRRYDECERTRVVHDDFHTYRGYKHYDLIVMNPPFDAGDAHLLRALEMQKRGGSIVCLLNAETLRNPYSATRRELLGQLKKYSAEIEYVKDAFSRAERQTDVEIAIVRVNIPAVQEDSDIYATMQKAVEHEGMHVEPQGEMVLHDFIRQMVQRYNVEVRASLELIRQYKAMRPRIMSDMRENSYPHSLLTLVTGGTGSHNEVEINRYMRDVRRKYWNALLCDGRFTGRLTSNLQQQYRERTGKLVDYEFSEFNIRQIVIELNAQMIAGVQETIVDLFDKLTSDHSWYPECTANRHYYSGWATNKAHKIGKKSIVPCRTSADSWSKKAFDSYRAAALLGDIEKTLNYLAGERSTDDIDLYATLTRAEENGQNRKIRCKYFTVDIFKKGTVHITYTDPTLIERLNIYAGRYKKWLPPNYGKTRYADMVEDERAVVDSFQGEDAYNEVMRRPDLYLMDAPGLLMLETGGGSTTSKAKAAL